MLRRTNFIFKAARRRQGFTQRDLAALVGDRGSSRVSRVELGRRVPSLELALAFQSILDVPVDVLFSEVAEELRERMGKRARQMVSTFARDEDRARATRRQRSLERLASE